MEDKYEIEMDLYADWIDFLKTRLQEMNCPANEADTPEQVSLGYFNLLKRRILPRPRKIVTSREFSCPPEHLKGLEKIKEKIEQGNDLYPYLHKPITNSKYNNLLLNDWGIHHLHLGTSLKNGFAKRTGAVLFARFTDETAFFINVLDHSKNASLQPWFDQALVRILHKNWPESISQFRVYGVQIPPSHSYDTIKESREDKIEVAGETAIRISKGNTYVSVEDAVYVLIGGGYTTDGTSMEAVIQTKSHVQAIKNLEKYIRSNYLQLMSLVEKKSIFPSSRFKFRLVINASNVVVVEEVSQQTWHTQLKFKDGMLKNSR